MNITDFSKVTFIDVYYRGFHAGITERGEGTASAIDFETQARQVKEAIDRMIAMGFEPSWNKQTNNDALPPQTAAIASPTTPREALGQAFTPHPDSDIAPVSLGNCKKCGSKNLMSKAGKVYCSAKCWLPEGER